MPTWRVTIRHGHPQRYHIEDVEAADVAAALRAAAERVPPERAGADLVELRLLADPERREYTGG